MIPGWPRLTRPSTGFHSRGSPIPSLVPALVPTTVPATVPATALATAAASPTYKASPEPGCVNNGQCP